MGQFDRMASDTEVRMNQRYVIELLNMGKNGTHWHSLMLSYLLLHPSHCCCHYITLLPRATPLLERTGCPRTSPAAFTAAFGALCQCPGSTGWSASCLAASTAHAQRWHTCTAPVPVGHCLEAHTSTAC